MRSRYCTTPPRGSSAGGVWRRVTTHGRPALLRFTPAALTAYRAAQAAGREPVVTGWSNDFEPDRSRSNPRGLAEHVITAVR